MKKKRWKLAGIFLMAALTVPSLGGCKVGNTQIRLSSGQLRNHNAIVRINDHKYDIRYAKLYLCNYRNLYGKAYGTDLWESYDADLEQYVKDVTVQELTHIACMDILAENQDMHLSEQEKKQAARAAKEYYQSLTEEEKTFIGLYEREIRTAYEEYALAEKLYHALQREMILLRLQVHTISRESLSAPLHVELIRMRWRRSCLISMTERVPM